MSQDTAALGATPVGHATSGAAEAPRTDPVGIAFKRTLKRLDVPIVVLAALLSLDMLGAISSFGAETFTWLVVFAVLWMAPYGLILAELGSAFPYEGGLYEWTQLAFGRFRAALASFFYWSINPLWIGGSVAFIGTEAWSTYIHPIGSGTAGDYAFKFAFIWATIAITIISLRHSRWILRIGTIAKLVLVGLFLVTALAYGIDNGFNGVGLAGGAPTIAGFLGILPLLLFSLVGFEVPSQAGDEITDPARDVPRGVALAGGIGIVAYALPVLAILAVLPGDEITGIAGFMSAIETVFGIYGDASGALLDLAALAFIVALAVTGAAWTLGANRSQAVAAADGAFFPYFGKFHDRWQTPVRLNVFTGIVATLFTVVAIAFADGDNAATFTVVLTITISTSLFAYMVMFPAALALRRKFPHTPRPYQVPGGTTGMALAAGLTFAFSALGAWVAVFPGTLEPLLGVDYDFVETWGVSRGRFELFTLGTLAVLAAIATIGYLSAAHERRPKDR